ncbi:MAG TPA: hypothetical protein DCQ99_03485 [Nitrospinae bacterium]|nr:hypothetical protein [Nitrospinota bacterium]HBA27330.1 hypothetical protein [Nitrospinota bacterium]
MAGITLTDAQTQLANWLTASTKVAQGQSYSISGRAVTRADAEEIRKQIIYWDRQVKRLTKGGITIKGATPV